METRILTGAGALDELGSSLDELHAATATPVTARRPWLATWARCHPRYEPLALVVAEGDRLLAAALLARRRKHGLDELVALGHGPSDLARLAARDSNAAAALSGAVIDHLSDLRGRWQLTMRHLPIGDPVAERIAGGLKSALLVLGDVSPSLRFGPDRTLRRYVSHNHHQQVRRMMNRMHKEGHTPVIAHLREATAIRAILPEVEDVCLSRDIHLRGRSALERPGSGSFFHQVVMEHAARGEVDLTTVQIDGRLAAYVLCFLDHGVWRMWSCRLAPEWGRYGIGRVGNDAALRHALADPSCTEFDWMRGAEPYKQSMSNHVERSQDLLAWSSRAVRTVVDAPRRLKAKAKGIVANNDWLVPGLQSALRLQAAGRRHWRSFVLGLRPQR